MNTSRSFMLILQMPPGGRVAGSEFTAAYDSTAGMPSIYYWVALGILLFIAFGVVKAYRDDKKWDGEFMQILSRAKRLQDEQRIVVRGNREAGQQGLPQGNLKKPS